MIINTHGRETSGHLELTIRHSSSSPARQQLATAEELVAEEAKRLHPGAKIKVSSWLGADYYCHTTAAITLRRDQRMAAIRQRLAEAKSARCACGYCRSWDHSVSGTSGVHDVVWAGCPNCSGSAIGRPILAADLAWYERQASATS